MLPLGKEYLRVTTPQTTDGTNLRYSKGKVVTKETHLPVTARKHLEAENALLPEHLHHTIEVVSEEAVYKPKGKPGPKPKTEAE